MFLLLNTGGLFLRRGD